MVIVGKTAEMAKRGPSTLKTGENSSKPVEAKRTPKKAQGKPSKKD